MRDTEDKAMEAFIVRKAEHGNVLFLILIAVVLFGALSYAFTSSSRSASGEDNNTSLINGAELNQYPSFLSYTVMSMMMDGVEVYDLQFNTPSDFGSLTSPDLGVFNASGGGAPYQSAEPVIMDSDTQGTWYFNADFEIQSIGTTRGSSPEGNEVIAFLPGIKKSVCTTLNDEAGVSVVIPDTTSDISVNYTTMMDNNYSIPASEIILGPAGSNGTDDLMSQPFGCFRNNGGEYVYYHIIVER